MCIAKHPIADLCRRIADLEYELEQELCDAKDSQKRYALRMLEKRQDARAVAILRQYLQPEPLALPPLSERAVQMRAMV